MADQGGGSVACTSCNECTVCKVDVKQKDKALSCDICMTWYHTECVKINQANYTSIKKISSMCQGFKWLCDKCDRFFVHMVSDLQSATEIHVKIDERCGKIETSFLSLTKEFNDLRESLKTKTEEIKGNTARELSEMKKYVEKIVSGKDALDKSSQGKVDGELTEIRDQIGELRSKYSEVLKGGLTDNSTTEIKENTIQAKKIQLEVNEAMERKKRENNLVIFGVEETGDIEVTKDKVNQIVGIVGVDQEKVKYFGRVGRITSTTKIRMVRIVCDDQETRRKLLMGSNKLRVMEGFERVYLSPDLTREQQAQDKILRDKLKELRVTHKDAKINNGEIIILEGGNRKILYPNQN